DMVGAIEPHQLGELIRREHDRIEIDLPEIAGRRLRQGAMCIRARTPGMIDAARIGSEIAAAMDGEDLQVRMALEHAVEDQVVQCDRGLERIADRVAEGETLESLAFGEAGRMQHDKRIELLGFLPERLEGRVGQLASGDVGENLGALETELADAALELFC